MGEAGTEQEADLSLEPEHPGTTQTARGRAYVRAFELLVAVQTPEPGIAAAIEALLAEARERQWPEVVRVAMFAALAAPPEEGDHDRKVAAVARLLLQAEHDGAPVMTALALATRASRLGSEAQDGAVTADDDLARATVILESATGPVMERISAHNACAQAYCDRWLWELADEQYAAALRLAPEPPAEWAHLVLPAIVYNRCEMQIDWACVQRQLGDEEGLRERWRTWEAAMAAAATVKMPPEWSIELDALGGLLGAIVGRDTAGDPRAQLDALVPANHPGAWPAGWLHLAVALSEQRSGGLERARAAVELAIEEIDPRYSPDPYDLALWVAAEIEADGRPSAAMQVARRQLQLRWAHRLTVLGSTVGRVQAERLRREHDVMTAQAHLDDLTGLLNRRGFARYLESVERHDVDSLSLLVADLDRFKAVNDHYGHQVGDTVLITVARLLQAHVRQADCAVRLGGDEFAVVLASAGLGVARRRAEAITAAISREPWEDLAPGLSISLSVGLSSGKPSEFSELIERADRALYEAKARGRGSIAAYLAEDESTAYGRLT